MHIKRKFVYEDLIYILIIVSTIAECECFRLFSIDTGILKGIVLFSIFIAIAMVLFYRNFKIRISEKYLYLYTAIIILFLVVQGLYTLMKYDAQTLMSFLQSSQGYLWIGLSIPLFILFNACVGMDSVLDTVKNLVWVTLIILIVAALAYNFLGLALFNVAKYKEFLLRNGRLRLWDLSSLEGLAIIWTFYEFLYKEKKKVWNIFFLAMMMLALFYVEQTRMMQVAVIVSIVLMYIFKKNDSKNAKANKFLLIFFTVIFILATGSIGEFWATFSVNGANGSSTRIRMDEIVYAIELFIDNPVNGVGIMPTSVRDLYINYTGAGKFGYTDIGIIGSMAQMGMWTLIVYCIPVLRFFYILLKVRNEKNKYYFPFLTGLFSFVIITSGTLLIINQSRIFMWPFCIAIFEYCYYCYKCGNRSIVHETKEK